MIGFRAAGDLPLIEPHDKRYAPPPQSISDFS